MNENYEVCRLLINAGADYNLRDEVGEINFQSNDCIYLSGVLIIGGLFVK